MLTQFSEFCCCAVVLWCCGAVVLWCCGAVVLWCCGAVVLRCCGAVVLWCCGAGAMVLSSGGHCGGLFADRCGDRCGIIAVVVLW
jgi:hypothetical protein